MSKVTIGIIGLIVALVALAFFSSAGLIFCIAAIGGLFVFLGLWIEHEADKEEKKEYLSNFTEDAKRSKLKSKVGWRILMMGIAMEVVIAGWEAVKTEIEMAKIKEQAIKNDPLKQPVARVSAVLRVIISAGEYDPKKPIALNDSYLSFGSFSLQAKEARWFEHVDAPSDLRRVLFYEIAVMFEQNILPSGVWNDINSTNSESSITSIPVTNALKQAAGFEAYINFIPKNAAVIKGSTRFLINGFQTDVLINSNYVSKQMSDWNPDRPGMFLSTTGTFH